MSKENVEFDQICLLLKHYLLLDEPVISFLDRFIRHDRNIYVNQLVERFNASGGKTNLQWMITEIIKYRVDDVLKLALSWAVLFFF
jgi:hypothetical protein